MKDQDHNPQGGSLINSDSNETLAAVPANKKHFVEPEISQPVDVLEATTFFQSVDSGATN